jgi:predicted NACHT family NTPase
MMRNLLLSSVDMYKQSGKIPFFVPLKDYNASYSMLDYVFAAANNFWPELTVDGLDYILAEGKGLLLFDGLDEIHSSLLADFTKKMNDFQDRYSKNSFIISSRPYSNFQSFTRSTVLILMPFSLPQALNLVDRYK